jgi:hypothetical protein
MQHVLHMMRAQSVAALAQYRSFMESPEKIEDTRLLRIHLILEEITELIAAILRCDEAETLDGICDAIYVLIGSAITMELPLARAFNAVHLSNMTKKPSAGKDNPRLQDKGADWRPPDIAKIIVDYRLSQAIHNAPIVPVRPTGVPESIAQVMDIHRATSVEKRVDT